MPKLQVKKCLLILQSSTVRLSQKWESWVFWVQPSKVKTQEEIPLFYWFKSRHASCHSLIACVYFPLLQVMAVRALLMWHMA